MVQLIKPITSKEEAHYEIMRDRFATKIKNKVFKLQPSFESNVSVDPDYLKLNKNYQQINPASYFKVMVDG